MKKKEPHAKKAAIIIDKLRKEYPTARIELRYGNTLELLVATILSAQCTDKRVNIVTQTLFQKYRTLQDYAHAVPQEFERDIRSAGFFRNKTKNIIGAARRIRKEFNGRMPETMEDLVTLPGVARKTANIVLFNAYGKQEGIAVDTHVKRLSQRVGLSGHENTEKIEQDLMAVVPRELWGQFTYWVIEHGRRVCMARSPRCPECVLKSICDYYSAMSVQR